ncbi:fibrous sheath-interacting protein 2-like [Anguilla rostrata]|uniref:Uncharacterized protein n=1 Tax=Anguilla anguilla TaxID=7936 RepID=A0A9D3SAD0_ANGAN|nr:fibrous sheath-interacting protein 2-like [Anguilla anguilla]KAG5855762.1 hypothetical protein ANANG_G00052580 [Anguilla anguilla]
MSQAKAKGTPISRAKLGEQIFVKTDDFILSDPQMHIIKPSYNSLHDPHLRKYYHRKDMQTLLRKRNFITGEKEVRCSFKEYKMHQRYLEHLKSIADRTNGEIQRSKMRLFLEKQQEGLIPLDMTLTDMREQLLEEEVECLRQVMRAEGFRGTRKYDPEDYRIEMDLLSWKVEERARLRRIEAEVRHEWNRERQLRDAQERRERKKHTAMVRKCTVHQLQVIEQAKLSEDSVMEERNKIYKPPSRNSAKKTNLTPSRNTTKTAAPSLQPTDRVQSFVIRPRKQTQVTQAASPEQNSAVEDEVEERSRKSRIQVSVV